MSEPPRAAPSGVLDAAPLALASGAVLAALSRGPGSAGAAVAISALALAAAAAGAIRGRGRAPRLAALLALVAGFSGISELAPRRPPYERLAGAVQQVERSWSEQLRAVDAVLRAEPPADEAAVAAWLDAQRNALGDDAGLVLTGADLATVAAWTGAGMRLSGDEREALRAQLAAPPAVIALRRGLVLRLVVARPVAGSARVLLAEVPLPAEPAAGALGRDLGSGVDASVRWQAWGEGVRAPVESTRGTTEAAPYWSLVPLMAPGGQVVARVSLEVLPAAAERARLAARRALLAAHLAALLLALYALNFTSGAGAALVAARLALAAAPGALDRLGRLGAEGWLSAGTARALGPLAPLVESPAAAALSGLTLVALAALVPLPRRPRARAGLAWIALAAAAGGLALAAALTLGERLSLLELVGPRGGRAIAAALALALTSPAWAALVLAVRLEPGAAWPRSGWAKGLVAALGAGALAAAAHGLAVPAAQRRAVDEGVAPAIASREGAWDRALDGALALTRPDPHPASLSPERDAIDLWWNSPLGRLGLASGVWKYDADGRLVDAFATGFPPLDPVPQLAAFGRDRAGTERPAQVSLSFVGGTFRVRLAQRARPQGGRWIAAVLEEPGNLPGRAGSDPLRARRGAGRDGALFPSAPELEPRLAWYDAARRVVHSDVEPAPLPPPAAPPEPAWRRAPVQGRRAAVLDLPDGEGSVSAIVFPPRPVAVGATAVSWSVLAAALALGALALRRFATDPSGSRAALAEGARRLVGRFRVQVAVLLLAAGLLPLLALGASLRVVAARQAAQQLATEGARAVGYARGFLQDYLALEGERGVVLDDALAAWLARTLGDDVNAYEGDGALIASSRPDLVRAGLLPDRLDGATWRRIVVERASLVEAPARRAPGGRVVSPAAAHGPLVPPNAAAGVVGVSLGRAGQRAAEELRDVDRALLISSALLVLLAAALVAPASRRLVGPLAELERATARIAGGSFDATVPETGYDETRSLARAFREMGASLAAQRAVLERRREAMERLIASMPLAVLALREDGTTWAANPEARALLEAAPDLPLPGDATPPLMVDLPRGGETRHLRVSTIRLPRQTGDEPARLVVVEDLSDTLRSERLTAWAEMARRIAHEIKNPLTPISLVVEHVRRLAAADDPRLPEVLDRALATIGEQVRVLRETSSEFSDYARLFAARTERLDLAPLLAGWLAPYELAPPAGVRFETDGPPALPPVLADPRLLRRALANLVLNALAAVETGGTVRVSWEPREGPPRTVAITVADTGPGIDPGRLAQLFEPDVTTRETGSGLGLPIARQAVEAQGGRIEVESLPGAGARFTLLLPLAAGPGGPLR
ncbi:MAG: ATP-binding protein [Acidobacteria bacterium]|jgi:signal transduction histidine kinase/HAMP domain-containing protein|nr:ATP-binding protein [Acidobacteriota bacterium]